MDIPVSEEVFKLIMQSGIAVVSAFIINSLLRSLIRVPHPFDNRRGRTYVIIAKNGITLVIVFVLLYALFKIWSIDIAPLLASAGIIGIVVGIGSRSLFEDLIAGIFLIPETKIAIGDYVTLSGGIEGTVDNIGLRSLTLISPGGAYTTVANGMIKQVTNHALGKAVVIQNIAVKVGQPVDRVLKVLRDVIASYEKDERPKLLKGSKVIGVTKIDHAYWIGVSLLTEPSMRGKIEADFNHRVVKAFEKAKLEFA